MEMMKSNCRKAAMETRQQHIQVDLGSLCVRIATIYATFQSLNCFRLMENIAPTPIKQLLPYIKAEKIKVQVCRIWRPRCPKLLLHIQACIAYWLMKGYKLNQ